MWGVVGLRVVLALNLLVLGSFWLVFYVGRLLVLSSSIAFKLEPFKKNRQEILLKKNRVIL